ncbi:transposase [Catenulispora yoronensis]|uniref:transposase n=1 Tax=Catenulispora yoronensis TaxID=450799 RepID=UPI00363EE112
MLPDRMPRRGGRWRDHRQVIDAIEWKYRNGSPWEELPEQFGSWEGVYTWLRNRALCRRSWSGSCSPPYWRSPQPRPRR